MPYKMYLFHKTKSKQMLLDTSKQFSNIFHEFIGKITKIKISPKS